MNGSVTAAAARLLGGGLLVAGAAFAGGEQLSRPLLPPDGLFGFTPCSSSKLSSASRWRGAGAEATFFCFFSVGAAGFSMSIVGSVAVAGSLTTLHLLLGRLVLALLLLADAALAGRGDLVVVQAFLGADDLVLPLELLVDRRGDVAARFLLAATGEAG